MRRPLRWLVVLVGLTLAGCSTPKDMRELGYHYDDSKRCFVKGPPYTGWDFAGDVLKIVGAALGGG